MQQIKKIKIGKNISVDVEPKIVSEDGVETWNVPNDIDDFKTMAIDTINWQIGDSVKKAVGNTNINLSASNAKAITLLAKIIISQNPDLSSLTDLEKDSYSKLIALADNGYADSSLLNFSLLSVSNYIASGTEKIARVLKAETINEVILVLNEE